MQCTYNASIQCPVFAFSIFTPTIINDLGYTATTAQLLSIPPYIIGCVFTVLIGITSDNLKLRGPFVILSASVALAGYGILYAAPANKPGLSYAGMIIAAAGVFPNIPVVLAWTGGNAGGDIKRGVAIAMAIGVANLGGIFSSFIYRDKDAPRYHIGHGTVIGCLLLAVIGSYAAMSTYARLNHKKVIKCRVEGIDRRKSRLFRDIGDASPLFRYSI